MNLNGWRSSVMDVHLFNASHWLLGLSHIICWNYRQESSS